ncbi:M48 family metalloprotease [Gallaecimonas pentaromativorans]|uniref:Beta-barrel assembly-enhancing protease n=1 Tax=Gallaecimonas pentaromativorans TaxID=584787 RepID=A0A3N1PS58_9GAMM|nr:M48 family metalloprotease [Gallaecimonas pentaromativorans]MED5524189.1 M48 family metalloprotease [Pseudomonadota bacterium]ROQ29951.1 putative Zn-dependent protease [Gallaecimonas pentaromativorans]
MKHKGIIAALLSVAMVSPLPVAANSDLPQIGTAGLSVLSLEKEELLGELYTYQLRAQAPMVRDPLVTEYIQALGHRLVSHADNVNYPFDFMVLNVNELNAFAYFGGHVAIFTKIITEADDEDELASVMAHEISHVTQRHLARKMEESQKSMPLTIASIVGSILVGIANPELGMAGLQASIAANQQFSINYTRSNEAEADRVGFNTLYHSGFDPMAMADFFQKLVDQYRFVSKPPEFLLDHPLSETRVAQARTRAMQLPKVIRKPSLDFELVKMLLRTQYGDPPDKVKPRLENELKNHEYVFEEAIHYGLGQVALMSDDYQGALDIANKLLKASPHSLYYKSLKVDALIGLDRGEEAARFLAPEAEIRPNSPVVALNLANAWVRADKGSEAIKVLEPYLYIHPDDSLAMDLMIQAQAQVKDVGEREAWQAEKLAYLGAFDRAIGHFNNAYKALGDNVIEQRRIEGRIAQLRAKKARFEALQRR